MAPPPEPILFMKATCALCGPNDPIVLPKGVREDRLGGGAGRRDRAGRQVRRARRKRSPTSRAMPCSTTSPSGPSRWNARRQRTKGKSCDTFAPIGPWLVTADEVGDPQELGLDLTVNGERRRTAPPGHGLLGRAARGLREPVHVAAAGRYYLHRHAGRRGHGRKPPRYLKAGRRRGDADRGARAAARGGRGGVRADAARRAALPRSGPAAASIHPGIFLARWRRRPGRLLAPRAPCRQADALAGRGALAAVKSASVAARKAVRVAARSIRSSWRAPS